MAPNFRILIVSSYYYPATVYGGPVAAMRQLCRALISSGQQVSVYTTNANGTGDLNVPLKIPVDVDGHSVTYFPRWWFGRRRKSFTLFFSPEMGRELQRLRPGDFDLILIHAAWGDPGRMAAKVAKHIKIPYIYYTYGGFEPWAFNHNYLKKRIYFELIERAILKMAAGIVVSNYSEAKILQDLGIRTEVRKIPCESIIYKSKMNSPIPRNKLITHFPNLKNRNFILFLSRLHFKKGLDLLIPAFATLSRNFPDWDLVLAGPDEGGYRRVLENLVKDLGLVDRVVFTGMVTGEAKTTLLTYADLFVLPSYSEGFPVVIAEALGYGRPLVITETCYVPEVEQGGAGLVVKPDRASLTIALHSMLQDDNLRRRCAARASEVAQRYFTWESVAEKSLAFYRETIQCRNTV